MSRTMLRFALALAAAGLLAACNSVPESTTVTPDDLLKSDSDLVGEGEIDPYRPEPTFRLMDVPAEPTPGGGGGGR